MGMYFICIVACVLLEADMTGVPDDLLLGHLLDTNLLHRLPGVSALMGMFLMTIGYGVDIGERSGCIHTFFGLVMGPMFVVIVIGLQYYMRLQRKKLNKRLGGQLVYGHSLLTPWLDR